MPAPTLAQIDGSGFTFGGSSGLTATLPTAPTEGQLLVQFYMGSGTSAAPSGITWGASGWNVLLAPQQVPAGSVAAAWKRAGASESATVSPTWTPGTGGNERLIIAAYDDVLATGNPVDDTNEQQYSFFGTTLALGELAAATTADTLRTIVVLSNGTLSAATMPGATRSVYGEFYPTGGGGSDFAMDARAWFTKAFATSTIPNENMTAGGATFEVYAFSFNLLPLAGGDAGPEHLIHTGRRYRRALAAL